MRAKLVSLATFCGVLACALSVQAAVVIETVPVGNPGNALDTRYYTPGHGSVNYVFAIGKYEITAGQYTEFLNAVADTDTYGLYDTSMSSSGYGNIVRSGSSGSYVYSVASGYANLPVNFVDWGDAARLANWLHNGQPSGSQDLTTTEDGSYFLDGATTNAELLAVTRKADATWVIPSENEWYKAAFYNPATSSYYEFATDSDTLPAAEPPPGGTNSANYDMAVGNLTEVEAYTLSKSPFGTFGQSDNVTEWNETILYNIRRGVRGGAFDTEAAYLHAWFISNDLPTGHGNDRGFRVARVPEPATLALLLLGGLALLRRRR